ncbi:DUF167 domain-containing protein [Arenicella chitinivorans]|nr:DUF167 domain-containing protein [Arenicella chitinivorans]
MRISIKVIANAAQTEVVGFVGEYLKLRIAAAPEKGKANKEIIRFLAKEWRLPKHAVQIESGHTSNLKIIRAQGLNPERLRAYRA